MDLNRQDQRGDRNIPNSVEREFYRGRMVETASRVAGTGGDEQEIWAEAAGPGSYRWVWKRGILLTPTITAWVSLSLCLGGFAAWIFNAPLLSGEILGSPSFPLASASLLGLLAISLLLLRVRETPARKRAGRGIALLVLSVSVASLVVEIIGVHPLDWGEGSLRDPAPAAVLNFLLLSLCLLTTDSDAPRYRWRKCLVPLAGIALTSSLLTKSTQALQFTEVPAGFSIAGSIGVGLIYLGYVFLRSDRGVARFLGASGPGPTMSRLLVPAAVVITASMIMADLIADNLPRPEASLLRSIDKILMLCLLLWVIIYVSRRLQGFYESWKRANVELTSQAGVLTRMAEGVVVMRLSDSQIVLSNPQYDAMHGYGPGELVGEHIDVTAPLDLNPDEITMRSEVMRELAENGEASFENRSLRKDGSIIWSRANAVVTTTPDQGPVLIIVKYDITEERLAKEAGREAEMRFKRVFEQSPIGLCLVTPEGGFAQVNESFERIIGYDAEELDHLTLAGITHPEDLEEEEQLNAELFSGARDSFTMEKRYLRKNGELVWVCLTVAMLRDQDGNPYQALTMVEDITERHRLGQQLKYLADHDPLTGLFNRRRFEEELTSAIDSGLGRGVALLVIDLDNFKFVNDSYGHTVGDRLIVRTADLLRSRLRADDTLARQGGDEFVVVLRDTTREAALATAEKLVGIIAREVRIEGAEYAVRVTASVGVAVASREDPVTDENLMMQADIAMYEAKEVGRNGAKLFQPGADSQVARGVDWAGRLSNALENDEMRLYAQPILRLDGTGPPVYELFIRMLGRNGSVIRPGTFLPMAERHDLVQELDRWVIRKALDTLSSHDHDVQPRFSINLSGRTVGDPALPEFVQRELARTGVDPANLIFEVTETSAIGNMGRAQDFSNHMTKIGCGFALDDFGTGFASFYYLKHLAFDFVKIDGEFVKNLASDSVNQLLVKALVDVSRCMGKETVAEQVEDARTMEILRGYGVDFVQGYHLGRPQPLDQCDFSALPESAAGRVSAG